MNWETGNQKSSPHLVHRDDLGNQPLNHLRRVERKDVAGGKYTSRGEKYMCVCISGQKCKCICAYMCSMCVYVCLSWCACVRACEYMSMRAMRTKPEGSLYTKNLLFRRLKKNNGKLLRDYTHVWFLQQKLASPCESSKDVEEQFRESCFENSCRSKKTNGCKISSSVQPNAHHQTTRENVHTKKKTKQIEREALPRTLSTSTTLSTGTVTSRMISLGTCKRCQRQQQAKVANTTNLGFFAVMHSIAIPFAFGFHDS